MRTLYWFRNDLRVSDNPLLYSAMTQSREAAFVYIHDPRQMYETVVGLPRLGWHRRRFLAQSLENLRVELRRFGLSLVELHGRPEIVLPQIMVENDIKHLYFCRECAPEERGVENELFLAAHKTGITIHYDWSQFLISPDLLPLSLSQLPQTFTDFRMKIEKGGLDQHIPPETSFEAMDTPQSFQIMSGGMQLSNLSKVSLSGVKSLVLQTDQPLPNEKAILDRVRKESAPMDKFEILQGGSEAARLRLEDYFFTTQTVSRYYETRNGLLNASDSTLFSAWLANGCLSPRQVFREIRRYERLYGVTKSSYWVIFELLWRDFFKLHLYRTGKLFFFPQGLNARRELSTVGSSKCKFEQKLVDVMSCQTGNSFIDANLRELIQTGFMSNRGRQNVASFMIYDLNIPWTIGAWIFESLLIDYDVASNWGNWAYIAGVSFDPRGGRKFNTQKQQEDYDPEGFYLSAWSL